MAGERAGDGHREAAKVSRSAEDIAWDKLMGEARAFENWYLPSRVSVNAWVGVGTNSGLYGGWSVNGDPLEDDWDESVMTTAVGNSPEEVIDDLIRIAQEYRARHDAERADLFVEEETP